MDSVNIINRQLHSFLRQPISLGSFFKNSVDIEAGKDVVQKLLLILLFYGLFTLSLR